MLIEDWVLDRFPEATYSTTNLRVNCPFCGDDTGKHLYIQIYGEPVAHCFRCEWRGSIYKAVSEVDNISYGEAILLISAVSMHRLRKKSEVTATPAGYIPFSRNSNPFSTEAGIVHRYLLQRNIPEETIREYCGIVPKSWRAWFVFDNFWQGRLVRPGQPKYISAEKPKDDVIWNAKALIGHRDIIICEGIISACNAGSNAIALLAKTATPEQLARIINAAPTSILIMLDADAVPESMLLLQNLMLEGYAGSIGIAKLAYGDPADCKEYTVHSNSFENRVKMYMDSGMPTQSPQSGRIITTPVNFPNLEALFLR